MSEHSGSVLNQKLVESQDLRKSEITTLENLHATLDKVFEAMEVFNAKDEPIVAAQFAELVEKIEYAMQRNWRFPEDATYHTWWIKVPGCMCPRMDNADNYGIDRRITSGACPWHGFRKKEKDDE